jgi:hypothetical protein
LTDIFATHNFFYGDFYSLCTLLFPSDLQDYSSYEEYFLSRRHWFSAFLAATFVADIIDTPTSKARPINIPSESNTRYESRQA